MFDAVSGDKCDDKVDSEWGKANAEIVDEMIEDVRDFGGWCSEDVADGDVIKSFGGGWVGGVAIHTWAQEEADNEANKSGADANKEPERRAFDFFVFDEHIYNDGGDNGDWCDGGRHTKEETKWGEDDGEGLWA